MPDAAAPVPAGPSPADKLARLKGRLMAQSLGQLLDRARGAREVLPHLAALERSLLEDGIAAIERVPGPWLQRICTQLSSLPLPDQDPSLHDLLERLLQRLQTVQRQPSHPGGLDPGQPVVVREISHSEFMAERNGQATTQPMSRL